MTWHDDDDGDDDKVSSWRRRRQLFVSAEATAASWLLSLLPGADRDAAAAFDHAVAAVAAAAASAADVAKHQCIYRFVTPINLKHRAVLYPFISGITTKRYKCIL